MSEPVGSTTSTAGADASQPHSALKRWLGDPRKPIGYSLVWGCGAGWWYIVGGVLGQGAQAATFPIRAVALVMLGYYTLCGWAGVRLIRGDQKATTLSILVQFPQLLQIQTPSLLLKVVCGLHAVLWWAGSQVGLGVGLASGFEFRWTHTGLPFGFAVNLVPAAILWYFWRHD